MDHVLPERAFAAANTVGDEEVLARRHPHEELDALERAPDAETGALVRGHPGEIAAVERDRAAVGLEQSEQAVEERGLARAVGPDEPDQLPRADFEPHFVERGDAREVLGDGVGFEQRHDPLPAVAATGATPLLSSGDAGSSLPLRPNLSIRPWMRA